MFPDASHLDFTLGLSDDLIMHVLTVMDKPRTNGELRGPAPGLDKHLIFPPLSSFGGNTGRGHETNIGVSSPSFVPVESSGVTSEESEVKGTMQTLSLRSRRGRFLPTEAAPCNECNENATGGLRPPDSDGEPLLPQLGPADLKDLEAIIAIAKRRSLERKVRSAAAGQRTGWRPAAECVADHPWLAAWTHASRAFAALDAEAEEGFD